MKYSFGIAFEQQTFKCLNMDVGSLMAKDLLTDHIWPKQSAHVYTFHGSHIQTIRYMISVKKKISVQVIAARFYFLVAVIRLTDSLSHLLYLLLLFCFLSVSHLTISNRLVFMRNVLLRGYLQMLNAMKLDAMARVKIKLILSSRDLISLMKANDSIYYGWNFSG